MRNLLDEVLERTTYGPEILSEVHDINRISWVEGLSDPGEMIRCGYMPEIRRRAGENDSDYAMRITPIVMALPVKERDIIMGAAIKRAALDTSNGRISVMVAGEAPWHKLGVHVKEAVKAADAIRLSGLDWSVSKRPLFWHESITDDAEEIKFSQLGWEESDSYGIVRDDTKAYLGTVGERYKPIQNRDGFDFLDSVIGEYGARYHTAGAIFGGKRVWMLVELPKQSFSLNSKDEVKAYALFTNCHDGIGAARCIPTNERPVCGNTLRRAMSNGKSDGISIRHTGDIKGKISDARSALGLAVKGFEDFKVEAEVMSRTRLVNHIGYFDGLLDMVCDVTAAEANKGADALAAALAVTEAQQAIEAERFGRQIERRKSLLADIIERYESERCGINGMRGTVWAGLNAVTEHADHNKIVRFNGSESAKESKRFESVLMGDADKLKQIAYTSAKTLIA